MKTHLAKIYDRTHHPAAESVTTAPAKPLENPFRSADNPPQGTLISDSETMPKRAANTPPAKPRRPSSDRHANRGGTRRVGAYVKAEIAQEFSAALREHGLTAQQAIEEFVISYAKNRLPREIREKIFKQTIENSRKALAL